MTADGGGVALDLAPEQWAADRPDARLLLVVQHPAVAHQLHDQQWAVVSGLRYQSKEDLEPVVTTVKVKVDALPPDVRVEAGTMMMPPADAPAEDGTP